MPNLNLESLKKSFDKLSDKLLRENGNPNLLCATEAWMDELDISEDARKAIREKTGNLSLDHTSSALSPIQLLQDIKLIDWRFPNKLIEVLFSLFENLWNQPSLQRGSSKEKASDVQKYLLLALLLVIGCFLIHSCFDKSASEDEFSRPGESPKSRPSQARNLALVVGENAKDLCKKLQKQQKVKSEDWQELYAKTQDLLLTDKLPDDLLHLQSEFIASEYSVYIILMTLRPKTNEDIDLIERGFTRGASSLDREDAFEQLPRIAQNVRVSDCLSPTSYQGQGFYQC